MSKPTFQFSTQYDTSFQQEFHELLTAFETLQNEHEALLTAYAEMAERNKNGKQYLTKQTEQLEQLNNRIKDFNDLQASAKNIFQKRTEEEQRTTRLLEQSAQAIEKQKQQIKSLTNTLESLNSEHQHDLQQQQTKIEKHWQAKIDKKQAEIDDLQQQLATAKKWQDTYLDELKKEQTTKAHCLERIETLKAQNSTLTAQAKTLKNTIETRNEQTNKLSGLITKFKAMFNA